MGDYFSDRYSDNVPTPSVGESVHAMPVRAHGHPAYQEYIAEVTKKVRDILARERVKQENSTQAVCTVALESMDRTGMDDAFPEFRIIYTDWHRPVHSLFVASREMVNQFMMMNARRYAQSYVHYGGRALSYLTAQQAHVHLQVDPSNVVAMQESYGDDQDCRRLDANVLTAAIRYGWQLDQQQVQDYQLSKRMVKCSDGANCTVQGKALIVDGALYALSPMQMMAAMAQHGSKVGFFCLPYDSSMILEADGEVGTTGVRFIREDEYIRFQYPDGVAGVSEYPAYVWHQWLLAVRRALHKDSPISYQFEQVGHRAGFMIMRVVMVNAPVVEDTVVQSLQLGDIKDYTMLYTWSLRKLSDNPRDRRSWVRKSATVETRIVEKVRDYAMGLPNNEFTPHAIRKRLSVVNDRTTLQGTIVEVHKPLRSEVLDVVEMAIFTRCFALRYAVGRLSENLLSVIRKTMSFAQASFPQRVGMLAIATIVLGFDYTIGPVLDGFRDVLDSASQMLRGKMGTLDDEFMPVPHFVRYESIIAQQAVGFTGRLRQIANKVPLASALIGNVAGYYTVLAITGVVTKGATVQAMSSTGEPIGITGEMFSDYVDMGEPGEPTEGGRKLLQQLRSANQLQQPAAGRQTHHLLMNEEGVSASDGSRQEYQYDPGFVQTLTDVHHAIFPDMAGQEFIYDPSSLSMDNQDRTLTAEYMSIPTYLGGAPTAREVYRSKVQGYEVTARPMTLQETLSGFAARNLSAPVVALPQDDDQLAYDIWENFLDVACVPDARAQLMRFQNDDVAMDPEAILDWSKKASPDKIARVIKILEEDPTAWELTELDRYEGMIKSDVKPPLSDKPINSRIEPQMIVFHRGVIIAIFSSIFRVLVRRLISLLKPNFLVNLLKDMPAARDLMQVHHLWGQALKYLENDFSKYDKSQGEFVHVFESYVFMQLGLNREMLSKWALGHVDSTIKSFATGISLAVRYQRKSGDATTAFGNVLVNICTVLYAYKGTDIVWAVFMGDDSLVCARSVTPGEAAVRTLAEKFNLIAKFYITDAPYFASNMILVNNDQQRIVCVPDPIKRIEKYSMAVSAVDPRFQDRYQSACDSLGVYMRRTNLVGLGNAVQQRYEVRERINIDALGDAIASSIRSFEDFRSMWEVESSTIRY